MQALADAILPAVKTAVAPVPAETWRVEETDFGGVTSVVVPSVWIRPPSTSAGAKPAQNRYRQGLVIIDIWAHSWDAVEVVEASLAWLNGHVTDAGHHYRLESGIPVLEPDAAHLTLTFGVLYDDMRGVA